MNNPWEDKERLAVVGPELDDDYAGDYPETDQTYIKGLMVAVHTLPKELVLDPTMRVDKAQESRDKGVLSAKFGGDRGNLWRIDVNWTPTFKGTLPAGYMRVSFSDTEVAILGPWATVRTCWKCGLTGLASKDALIGRCIPHFPCPHCGVTDWLGRVVAPEDFQEACAEFLAKECEHVGKGDAMYEAYRPTKKSNEAPPQSGSEKGEVA